MKRRYYGARFLGGNRTCTTGHPNPNTGRMSIACDIEVFHSKTERDSWVDSETFQGSQAGERTAVTRKEARNLCLGLTAEEFENTLDAAEMSRYPDEA